MSFCLPKFASEEMLKKFKSGEINPDKLIEMTSEERNKYFSDFVGEDNAKNVNALFEGKLLLKNQQRGIINWAKQVTGIKPEIKRDILTRVEKMTEVLQPKELDAFLNDLASKRLGFGVSLEEANKIASLAKGVEDARGSSNRLDFGRAKVSFNNYVQDLKIQAAKQTIGEQIKTPLKTISKAAGYAKSLKASLDNSAIFRQGWKTMFTDPKIWFKNAVGSFKDIAGTLGNKPVMDEIKAEILSRSTYDKMVKAKLAIGNVEEAFPESLPEKIPGFGRIYKASENAYTGFIYKMRADLFDKYLDIAEKSRLDITDKEQLEGVGRLVNSLTGRGSLGKYEGSFADAVNNIFFSPRFLKAHIDTFTLPIGVDVTGGEVTPFMRKQAAKNLAKIVAGTALVLAIARALNPDSVELDPRSSDFGKIKIGDTRFDVSGGMSSLSALAARILTFSSKSSVTGDVTPLNSGKFGAPTGVDTVVSFLENKASPAFALMLDYLRGHDSSGKPITPTGEFVNTFAPLPITTFNELKNNPNSANILAAMIADGMGISVNTYTGGSAGLVAEDKPGVLDEMFSKLVSGDKEGATKLAHDFNVKLKEEITNELKAKNQGMDPNKLEETIDTKYKKEALYIPTDEQVKDYESTGKDVVEKILSNGKPVVVTDTPIPSKGIIGTVVTYAQALGTDPVTAFNRIFTGQRITRVTNGTVIVERMSLDASQKVKTDRGGNNPTMKLDHTIPLQLGGSNDESNLKLVPTDDWKSYTPVEDYLGNALKNKKVSKSDAQKLIADFKNKEITFAQIKEKVDKK